MCVQHFLDSHFISYNYYYYNGVFGVSERDAVVGQVHCVGTERELLECSHSSFGRHYCGWYYYYRYYQDIVISCYGMLLRLFFRVIPSTENNCYYFTR